MRTVVKTYNVYTFEELSAEAQEWALIDLRGKEYNNLEFYTEEYSDTLYAIAEFLNCNPSWCSYSDGVTMECSFTSKAPFEIEELEGKRAYAYIMNNFIIPTMKKKTYSMRHGINQYTKKRQSKIIYTEDNCPFTGFYADICFIEAWLDWKRHFNSKSTVDRFFDLIAKYLSKYWTEENEYRLSDEGLKEEIDANGFNFLEDGTIYWD